jgi:uncharacterized protein with PQ loop repeat
MSSLPAFVRVAAPLVTTIQHIPQVYKIWKTQSVRDLSIEALLLMLCASSLWVAHAYFNQDDALMCSSLVALVIDICVLTMVLRMRS